MLIAVAAQAASLALQQSFSDVAYFNGNAQRAAPETELLSSRYLNAAQDGAALRSGDHFEAFRYNVLLMHVVAVEPLTIQHLRRLR